MNSVSVSGLVPQLRGRALLARYNYATVFVDHFSGFDYVHLHEHNDAKLSSKPNPVSNNSQNPSMSGSSTTIATTEFLLIRPTQPHVKLAIKASVSVVSMRIIKAVLPRNELATFKILHGPCFSSPITAHQLCFRLHPSKGRNKNTNPEICPNI